MGATKNTSELRNQITGKLGLVYDTLDMQPITFKSLAFQKYVRNVLFKGDEICDFTRKGDQSSALNFFGKLLEDV